MLAQYGWQATYIFFAGAIALFTVVPSLLLRSRPRELGLAPYGASVTAMESAKPEEEGLSLREAVSTMSFWLLALMVFFASVEVMGVQMHLVPYLCDIGHDSAFASLVMGITLGMLVPAKVIVGLVSDRWGIGRALALVFGCTVAGLALLFGADSATAAVTGGVLFSFGITVQTVFPPLMTARSAGLRHFGVVFGVVNLFMMLGSGIGTPLSGYIYDARGSYLPAFKIYIALAVLSAVLGLFAMRASRFGEELGVKG
ncbi:MAG: Major Facilitator Superfamily protein [Spirochaetes bacterium ADurb.BinA120]|nr:MAG: Major Facilitator Superfamily protein [Spirochaetes bacterium ADurb.BinA120]